MRTAVLVTGSRDWTDYGPIETRLALYPMGSILIHGDCGKPIRVAGETAKWKGADKIAGYVGARAGLIVWRLPYFDDLGKRGGPKRNECMFEMLLVLRDAGFVCSVEAFPIGRSTGTRGMIQIVEQRNLDLRANNDGRISCCVTEGT